VKPIQMMGWPIVSLHFNRKATDLDADEWLHDLSVLLAKKKPFTMIVQARPDSQLSPASRKAMGLWFRQHRNGMERYCKGVVRLVVSDSEGERVVSHNMKKAMPFPMVALTDYDQARDWAIRHLHETL